MIVCQSIDSYIHPNSELCTLSTKRIWEITMNGSEENKLMNFFITNFPGFTFKVVKM